MAKAKKKDPAAMALGRKGGKMSRINLSPKRRTELARKAAAARWKGRRLGLAADNELRSKILENRRAHRLFVNDNEDIYLLALRARLPQFWRELYRIVQTGMDSNRVRLLP